MERQGRDRGGRGGGGEEWSRYLLCLLALYFWKMPSVDLHIYLVGVSTLAHLLLYLIVDIWRVWRGGKKWGGVALGSREVEQREPVEAGLSLMHEEHVWRYEHERNFGYYKLYFVKGNIYSYYNCITPRKYYSLCNGSVLRIWKIREIVIKLKFAYFC